MCANDHETEVKSVRRGHSRLHISTAWQGSEDTVLMPRKSLHLSQRTSETSEMCLLNSGNDQNRKKIKAPGAMLDMYVERKKRFNQLASSNGCPAHFSITTSLKTLKKKFGRFQPHWNIFIKVVDDIVVNDGAKEVHKGKEGLYSRSLKRVTSKNRPKPNFRN